MNECVEEEVVDGDSVGGNTTYLLPDNTSFLYTYNTHTHILFLLLSLKFPFRPYSQKWCFPP